LQLPQQLRIRSCFVVIGGAPERQRLSDMIPERLRHDIISAHENPRKNLRKILYEKYEKFSCFFLQAYGIFNYCRGTCGPQSRPDRGAGLEVAMFH